MNKTPNYTLEQLYGRCLEAVNQISGGASEKSIDKYLQEMGFFNKDTTYLNAVYGIIDLSNLSFRYITNTTIALGVSEENFIKKGFSQFLQTMIPEAKNTSAAPALLSFLMDSLKNTPTDLRQNFAAYAYGIKHLRPSGKAFHSMVQLFGLEYDKNNFPTLCFFVVQDIDHLIKPTDQYWGRININNGAFITTFSSKDMILKKQDIFSKRELDVLKLLLKGFESKQIAEKLFISSNTVDNHRKNMIRRLDARDTTALVQLTKYLGILK